MRKILILFIVFIVILMIISCATPPEKEIKAKAKKAEAAPTEEYSRAKELREKIEQNNLDKYAFDEYQMGEEK